MQNTEMISGRPRAWHILSIDFEEWFQVNSFADRWNVRDWDTLECRLPQQAERLLELFGATGAVATFFIVGWVAQRYPDLVRQVADAGHEIASHGDEHKPIPTQSPEAFAADLARSKKILEDITGKPVYGYRAPNWSLTEEADWAVEILEEAGFTYDSSIYPIAIRYGRKTAPRFPFKLGHSLREYPLSTFSLGGVRIPVGGGVFFRAQPLWLTRLAIRSYQTAGNPFIMYLHPWEIDPDHPRVNVRFTKKIIHYYGLKSTFGKLQALLQEFAFTSFSGLPEMGAVGLI